MVIIKRCKIIFRVLIANTRCVKFRRPKAMKQAKVAVGAVAITCCFITLLLYNWYYDTTPQIVYQTYRSGGTVSPLRNYTTHTDTPMRHVPLNEIYPDDTAYNESLEEFENQPKSLFINTPACQIPVAMIHFGKYKKQQHTCGKRAVYLQKVNETNVRFSIKSRVMKEYTHKSTSFYCCYRFIMKPHDSDYKNRKIEYTPCNKIKDGQDIPLESEFINVNCFKYDVYNVSYKIYDDAYAFIKKIPDISQQISKKQRYNVLMIGMDSMSLSRTVKNMPRTINFFKDNSWLGFRGYHKVADNKFPNLIAALTGRDLNTFADMCWDKMDKCNNLLIWSIFKKSGYVTAYGEDYLRFPDTFNKNFEFTHPPTDHHLRTFYVHEEKELYNGSLVCTGKKPSGQHLLNYAFDFANTYRYDQYFGVFWMNSFSHAVYSHPQDADKMFEDFFNRLTYTGILENTFIIFFSDHGIRFGEYRVQPASYYEERMPALLMWAPLKFKGEYPQFFKMTVYNQYRLITPYDLYNTLVNINSLFESSDSTVGAAKACLRCHSMFKIISGNRTCNDVNIHAKWCSCHHLYPLDTHDSEGIKSVIYAAAQINSRIQNMSTNRCWRCLKLSLNKILRIHFYYDKLSLYYVVAFSMTPGNMSYEAVVSKNNSTLELVGAISVISAYKHLGECTAYNNRLFCVCDSYDVC
ncbi:hypothetical protein ACJJTC_008539 [Scirpophaga incertulas]